MLKGIVAAIVSALRSLGGFARRVVAAPFQTLANIFGGGGDPPAVPPVATPTPDDEGEPAPGPDMSAIYRDLAIAVRTWCAQSIVEGQPMPLPPKFPRSTAEWLRGISVDEAHAIINASEFAVYAHLRSRELILGVRSVRPLPPSVWPEESRSQLNEDSSVITCDAGYALAR